MSADISTTLDPGWVTSITGRQAPDVAGFLPAADAAASTPALPAARIVFHPVSTLASVCGLTVEALLQIARAHHFRAGFDYLITPAGWELREGALGEIVGELAVTSRGEACRRLWAWLQARHQLAAGSGGAVGSKSGLDAASGLAATPARKSLPWLNAWEMAHEQ